MAKDEKTKQPQGGPQPPARGDAFSTADLPTGGPNSVDQTESAKPTQVASDARSLPDLSRTGIAPDDIREAGRERTIGPGSSAQVNSGAAPINDLFADTDEDFEDTDEDDDDESPKLVVLDTYITGPGGGPHVRGKVVSIRQILGHALYDDENRRKEAKRTLKRYFDLKAVRRATSEEAELDVVQFPEGEAALTGALDDANARADAERQRADELQRQLDALKDKQGSTEGLENKADDSDF